MNSRVRVEQSNAGVGPCFDSSHSRGGEPREEWVWFVAVFGFPLHLEIPNLRRGLCLAVLAWVKPQTGRSLRVRVSKAPDSASLGRPETQGASRDTRVARIVKTSAHGTVQICGTCFVWWRYFWVGPKKAQVTRSFRNPLRGSLQRPRSAEAGRHWFRRGRRSSAHSGRMKGSREVNQIPMHLTGRNEKNGRAFTFASSFGFVAMMIRVLCAYLNLSSVY